ncbi:hypothetical protein LCGC14_2887920, partial [marine sediment metagenome]
PISSDSIPDNADHLARQMLRENGLPAHDIDTLATADLKVYYIGHTKQIDILHPLSLTSILDNKTRYLQGSLRRLVNLDLVDRYYAPRALDAGNKLTYYRIKGTGESSIKELESLIDPDLMSVFKKVENGSGIKITEFTPSKLRDIFGSSWLKNFEIYNITKSTQNSQFDGIDVMKLRESLIDKGLFKSITKKKVSNYLSQLCNSTLPLLKREKSANKFTYYFR